MPVVRNHLKNLYRTHSEINDRKNYLRLDMNENVDGLPDDFIKSVLNHVDGNFIATYPEYRILKEKLATHNNIHADNICLSNGSDAAIKYIFEAYVSPGDKVLLTDPTFAMYPVYGKMFDADVSIVKYSLEMLLSEEDFCNMISHKPRLAVIINPNNPTGSVLPRDSLVNILDKAAENDTLLVVDEAYFYYYPETIIDLTVKYNNLIVLRTFSKLCGIAAARLGYAAACPEIINNLRRVKPTYDVNALAVLFAEHLLDRPELMQELMITVSQGKNFLGQKLSSEGIDHQLGHANFVLIRCGDRVAEIAEGLADKSVLVGSGFRQAFLKDYIRVTVGKKEKMERFWKEFVRIWRS